MKPRGDVINLTTANTVKAKKKPLKSFGSAAAAVNNTTSAKAKL
jgi:hypothetical protein